MALNPDKSEAILLGTRQRGHSYSSLATVNVAGSQIPLADHIKILGVTLDKNLNVNKHVMLSVSPFIIISVPYATSVPLYLKTWPKWLRVPSLAPASTTLTLFYLEPLRKTSPNSKKSPEPPRPCYLFSSILSLLQQLHWLPSKHHIDFKIANITFRSLHCSQPTGMQR